MVILRHNLGDSQVSVYRTIGPSLVYFETGSVKLSDIFLVAEWTYQVVLVFVYHVDIKLISYSDFYV